VSVRVEVTLTNAEAAAVLRSQGLSAGHGVRKSIALQSAEMKLIGAVGAASAAAPCPACGSSDHDGWTDHADCPEDWTIQP
jgi:hypothetical protein